MYQPTTLYRTLWTSLILWWGLGGCLWAFDPMVYQQIRGMWSSGDVQGSIEQVEKQVKKDKKEAQWYFLLDDMYAAQNNTTARINTLERALKVKKLTERETATLRLGQAYFDNGQYQQAKQIYTMLPPCQAQERALKACDVADSLRNNPVDSERISMGNNINLPYDNIWPGLTANGQVFCSTVVWGKRGFVGNTQQLQENIYMSRKKNGVWQPTQALPYPINTDCNEGSPCFSANGKYLFFVRCGDKRGKGSCDIYYCVWQNGAWSAPILADAPLNSPYWESTPCLSANGKELYFSSNRPGGMGKKDIWVCTVTYLQNGRLQFGNPQPLGSPINTAWDEISPFLHTNDSTLYFSSNGHYGMGGLDVFCSTRTTHNRWSTPKNMGYPINTHTDEMGWIVSTDGKTAYMAADSSLQGASHKIIFQISLPQALQPKAATPAQLWAIEEVFTLHHIYFDFNQATLQASSKKELLLLAQLMQENPSLRFTITGHTDNVGSEEYNLNLSKKRAESVVQFLVEQGIDPNRLNSVGRGSHAPVESNDTEWGRAQNRRIEVSKAQQ